MRRSKILALLVALAAAAAAAQGASAGWGPETPSFNLEAILRPVAGGPAQGFGHVEFRQPNDASTTIHLDVWVRGLAPDHVYVVQRAIDTNVDGNCTGANWTMPTLGTIMTDDGGTGRAELLRPLPPTVVPGTRFDIHFRVAETAEAASGVLESGCYQYTVSQ